MATENLAGVYRRYLQCLNERRWDDLGEFVDERLLYNQKPMSLADYRSSRQAETRATPDLRFTADLIVADAETVGCRLHFRCTPTESFLGFPPTGKPISSAEHVFYRFRHNRIVEVWSLIDVQAIAAQTAN